MMAAPQLKPIHSVDNPLFKRLKKIAGSSRERREAGQTLLDGVHLLTAYLDQGRLPRQLAVRSGAERHPEIADCLARCADVPGVSLAPNLFNQLAPVEHATGILAVVDVPQAEASENRCVLLLENVQDPGNLGGILRSAAAAGADAVYLSRGCAEAWSPKALRAGMGGHFRLAIFEQQDLAAVAGALPRVIATALGAPQTLFDTVLTGPVAFVFGNEGAGVTPELLRHATQQVAIPMPGRVESLNVAAAVAVCLFERVRQCR